MLNIIDYRIRSIKAVTVCVDYSDYLKLTISNKQYLDDWIIVTSPKDHKTIELCKSKKIQYKLSERLYQNNDVFNKGKALNDGFSKIKNADWLLALDADIILPKDFRNLNFLKFDRKYLYGLRRYTSSFGDLQEYLQGKVGLEVFKQIEELPSIEKWVLGYFQLFHSSQVNLQQVYPEFYNDTAQEDCNSAAFYDIVFAKKYKKRQGYFESTKVIHIPHEFAKNWHGRVTWQLPNTSLVI